jgi:hypothetical protein
MQFERLPKKMYVACRQVKAEVDMANVLVLGGSFAGVVAAESLVRRLGQPHQITLIAAETKFLDIVLAREARR